MQHAASYISYCSGTLAEPAGEEGFIALVAGTEQVCRHWLSSSVVERRVYYPLVHYPY